MKNMVKEPGPKPRRSENILLLSGIGIAVFFWCFDAIVDTVVFEEGGFWGNLLAPDPMDTWMRMVVVALIIWISIYGRRHIISLKRTEEELSSSEERYHAIFVQAADSIVLINVETGELVDFNESTYKTLGYTREEFAKFRLHDFEVIESEEEVKRHIEKIAGEGSDSFETKHRTKSGEIRNVFVKSKTITIGGKVFLQSTWRDITERKRAEEAVQESRERFDLAVKGSSDGFWDWPDVSKDEEWWSPRWYELLGYKNGEVKACYANFRSFLHPDDQDRTKEAIRVHFEDRVPFDMEYRLRTKSGEYRWYQACGQALWDKKGNPTRMSGSIHDITERKRAEEELAKHKEHLEELVDERTAALKTANEALVREITERKSAEEELREKNRLNQLLLDSLPHPALIVNKQRRIITANNSAVEMGAREGGVCWRDWGHCAFINEKDKKRIDHSDPSTYAGVKCWFCQADETLETVRAHNDPAVQVGETTFDTYWVPLGHDDMYLHYAIDVTERKRAEEELKASKAKYEDLYENAPEMYVSIDSKNANIIQCNQAAARALGLGKEEILGRPVFDFYHPDCLEDAKKYFRTFIETGEMKNAELQLKQKDGSKIYVILSVSAERDKEGKILYSRSIWSDVTERKKLEEQLLQSQKMDVVGRLAGGIAHDFNNMMTTVKAMSSLGITKVEETDPLHMYFKNIQSASERAISLTRQLSVFTRKRPTKPVATNLDYLVGKMLEILPPTIGEEINISIESEPGLWTVMADRGNMEQVIMNLALNARDAMEGGGTLTIKTENLTLEHHAGESVPEAQSGPFVCLSVKDTGLGMDEATMKHVFEPFFTMKEVGKGTGLGLSVVYGIVKSHNGWVDVESSPEKGTTFSVYLPAIEERHEDEGGKTPKSLKKLMGTGERILLVEDEETVRETAKIVLTNYGYEVVDAMDSKSGLGAFKSEKGNFDLALIDVVLPDKNGTELARELIALKPELPIILMSGYMDDKVQMPRILKEKSTFLAKPWEVSDLLQAIKKSIEASGE